MTKTVLWLVTVAALTFAASTAAFGQAVDGAVLPPGANALEGAGNAAADVPVGDADAAAPTAVGRVDKFDPMRRTLTLDNGDTYVLAANVAGAETVTPGQFVTLTYKIDGEQKIVQAITPAAGVPEADAPGMPLPPLDRLENPAAN